jgi:hypothetical protein
MELVDVATFFDRVPAIDPVTGHTLFNCQLLAYDESKRDAFTAYRRVMSTNPDVTLPADRVVELHGVNWMVGDGQTDGWEAAHRRKHVLHKAVGRANVYRLAAWLAGTPSSTPFGDLQWVKDVKELEVSSRSPQKFIAIFASPVELSEYDVVTFAGRAVLITSVMRSAAGYAEGTGNLQETPLVSVTLGQRTYNPATGGYTAGSTATVNAMKVRWQELYAYEDQLAERYQEGDCTWVLPSTATVTTATELIFGSEKYTVLAVRTVAGCKAVHARLK